MKLVASMIVRNEMDRLLVPCVESLLTYCDEVRVVDDGSDDGTFEWLLEQEGVVVKRNDTIPWSLDEGIARNALLQWTLEANPTHVFAVDADEFLSDGKQLRDYLKADDYYWVFMPRMMEVWEATDDHLGIRVDGGWGPTRATIIYAVDPPDDRDETLWRILPRKLASGREPQAAIEANRMLRGGYAPVDVYHFGWTHVGRRQARYDRYMEADGGEFHNSEHLQSIMYPPELVAVSPKEWPASLPKDEILAFVNSPL